MEDFRGVCGIGNHGDNTQVDFRQVGPYTGHGSFAFVGTTFGPNGHLSLPSEDVGVAVAYSMILAGFSENKLWKGVWYLLGALTCLGRIYHDQHWLSDVVLAAIISISVGNFINHSRSQEEVLLESHD